MLVRALRRRVVVPGARPLSSVAVGAVDGPGLPTAPGLKPVVGHAMNFESQEFCDYLHRTALDNDTWSFRLELGSRRPAVIGDPAMAQAFTRANSGWGGRSAATLPFVLDSTEAVVGDPLAMGIGFANGPVHHAPARRVAADGLLKKSFVEESEAQIVAKTNELTACLAATDGEPVDVQVLMIDHVSFNTPLSSNHLITNVGRLRAVRA